MRQEIRNWVWVVIAVFLLYVGVSTAFFNHASYRILGLPPMLFWFTLMPIVTPIILGALYLRDKKINPQWDEEGDN